MSASVLFTTYSTAKAEEGGVNDGFSKIEFEAENKAGEAKPFTDADLEAIAKALDTAATDGTPQSDYVNFFCRNGISNDFVI